jgi:CRISPR-associated protein Cmr3
MVRQTMSNFLIKFTPIEKFFFGGEQTFGCLKNINYYGKSNSFPQQTTILGTLRKEILVQKNILKEDFHYSKDEKKEIAIFIGSGSFNLRSPKEQDFGLIKRISPVFLTKENKSFIKTPLNHRRTFKPDPGKSFTDKIRDFNPCLNGYSSKKGLPNSFLSFDGKTVYEFNSIFKETIKIGIDKDRSEEDEGKFFKQQFYRFSQKEYSFAVIADLDIELKSNTVFMGADNSSFFMTVSKCSIEKEFEKIVGINPEPDKVILLSDALVKPEIYKYCDFSITKSTNFRNLQPLNDKFSFKENEKYSFIQKGSVFFTGNKNKVIEMLSNNKNLQKIGYNIFI